LLFENTNHQKFYIILYKSLKNGENFVQFINKYIKPKDNDFTLTNYKNLVNSNAIITGNEIWTDSKCLLIHLSTIENIKEKYDKFI
jgi:hypothetical protein